MAPKNVAPTRPGLRRWSFSALAAAVLGMIGCSSTQPRRDPTGEVFPSVTGESLDGQKVKLPEAFAGRPLLLLVGYEQESQFDIDRWLLGLQQAGVKIDVREVPTIPGLLPGLLASRIDEGMRSGIPREDWAAVVTVYADAGAIARFTGNDNGLPGRVLLLDAMGKVAFFHDRGYSVGTLQKLQQAIAALGK